MATRPHGARALGRFSGALLRVHYYTFFAGRYLNPILPCLAVFAGLSIASLETRFGKAVAGLVAGLACLQPLYQSIQIDRLLAGDDTRTLARRWIVENVASGETLVLQSYSVPLPQSAASFRRSLEANDGFGELERRGKICLAPRRR